MQQRPSANEVNARERLWRVLFFWFSAVMAGLALVELDAGRLAGAAEDTGVSCLMLSLITRFPVVRAIVGAAAKRTSPSELQRETERLRSTQPWTEHLANVGWTLLLGSLILRALGAD